MAGVLRRSFRWNSEKKTTLTIVIPRSSTGFGFTVAWTKPPLVDFVNEGGSAEKVGLLPGDKIICIDKVPVLKRGREEIENIVKNVKDILEIEVIRPEGELATRKRQTSLRRKESFTKKGTKMVIQDAQIMYWRRERALLKLLLCEEDLLNVVLLGKEKYILPLRKQHTLSTSIEMDILFGNIEEVGTVHEKQVQQFRLLTQGFDDEIGKLYQKQVDERLSVLRKYVLNLPLAKVLLSFKCINTPFKNFLEDSLSEEDRTDLLFIIEKPLKYISDLTTQLASLLSCTAVGHRDYVCLESVVSIFRTFEGEMRDVMNKVSGFEDLENAESPFDGEEPYVNLETLQEKTLFTKGPKDFSLIHPGRYWLFAGQLAKVEGRHYTEYWALLLSDCLIIARRTEQGVLLVFDEIVFLKSIYQVTFQSKKCDTEFRILFALQGSREPSDYLNKWTTWILRAPCAGIKLLWQAALQYQLSLFSTEALTSGAKSRFVHAKPSIVFRGVLPKNTSKYEESSFMTILEGPLATIPKHADSNKTPQNIQNNRITIAAELALKKQQRGELGKNCSYSSLTETVRRNESKAKGVTRSKSFGNDFNDVFPFIDSAEENNSGTESIITNTRGGTVGTGTDPVYHSAPNTPKATNRLAQIVESPGRKRGIKKFPRLGTFERLKLDKNKSPQAVEVQKAYRTRTGTSAKHRRQVPSTISKEHLLSAGSVSPASDEYTKESQIVGSCSPIPRRKRGKGFFSRFWRRGKQNQPIETGTVDEEVTILNTGDFHSSFRNDDNILMNPTATEPVASRGVLAVETENNNAKWSLSAMEKYMRDQSESSVSLGLINTQPPTTTSKHKLPPTPNNSVTDHNATDQSAGEESSPSWGSSSTGNTPSFGSSGVAFEFNNAPVITTTGCTPHSTPDHHKKGHRQSAGAIVTASNDLLEALDSGLELSFNKPRKSRKDSDGSDHHHHQKGTPTKTSKLSKLLRRTHSAGGSKDVGTPNYFSKEKAPVAKTKSADSAPSSREDGEEKQKKSRKTLAQDMKMRLSFLRRRHTDSSLQPSSVRPSPQEAHKWAESFQELTNSKYGLALFRAFLSREFSEENIEFWLACEDYKRTRPNKLQAKARKIYDDFLAVQAPKEVNLDSSMRSAIGERLQNPDRHSFDSAQRRIQGLMEQDAYVRFLHSDLYTDLAQGNSSHTAS